QRLQFLVREEDVLILRHLAALHQLAALDGALAARTPDLLLDARLADPVDQVEGRLLRVRGDVEAYRDGHQAEAHGRRSDSACRHGSQQKPSGPGSVKPRS